MCSLCAWTCQYLCFGMINGWGLHRSTWGPRGPTQDLHRSRIHLIFDGLGRILSLSLSPGWKWCVMPEWICLVSVSVLHGSQSQLGSGSVWSINISPACPLASFTPSASSPSPPHLEETVNREINRSEAALCSSSQLSDCENCQEWDVAQLLICLHWSTSLPFPQHLLAPPASLRLRHATAGAVQRRPLTSSGGSASLADTCPLTADGTYYYELHFRSSVWWMDQTGPCILAQMDVVIIRARKCMRWKQASTFLPWNGKKNK